ncbi:MAG TPA: acetylornithine/succinyldiaminopimelate transaminase [Verrucomicrobiae bacterium]|nr:acetylornithine/succinyldiaminopimelate transaminase [Verrucomicrobiae bacterium]
MNTVTRQTFNEVMVPNYHPAEIIPVRGAGSRFWDQSGREYVDFACGIAVTLLGHCHPKLVAALEAQAHQLWHLSNVMTNEPALRLAKKLTQATFAERVFFCNSGAEANEAALKLARRHGQMKHGSQKNEIVSFHNAFHGRTLFTVSVGGQEKYTKGFEPLPGGITHLPFNDTRALEAAVSERTCAIILELVQGEGGILPIDPAFVRKARELCDKFGALLIFDEIQTGMGRSGTLFAYQQVGVTPDVLTSAKGLGGGFPIGAMLTTAAIADSLPFGTHGSTYGGNPLGCAVGEAVMELVTDPQLLAGVQQRAALIRENLVKLARYGVFEAPRGMGLLIGAPMAAAWKGKAKEVVNAGLRHGVWTLVAGPDVLRLAPSLIIPEADIAEGFKRLELALQELTALPKAAGK